MVRNCSHSIGFKHQVAQDCLAGETLHSLARRHDLSRNLIRIWIRKFEAGAVDDEAAAETMAMISESFEGLWLSRVQAALRHRGLVVDHKKIGRLMREPVRSGNEKMDE